MDAITDHGCMEEVILGGHCSATIKGKLPVSLKDYGCFTLTCEISEVKKLKRLCDLVGFGINLMPSTMFNKLGPYRVKQTHLCLQMVDCSLKIPLSIVEDLMV